jgi:hypothetical protein
MGIDPAAVRFRLSASQISPICDGLDHIARGSVNYREGNRHLCCYPFRTFPPPPGFDRGRYNSDFMKQVLELGRKLRPKSKRGGRVQMNAIDLRAAIFAVRVSKDWWRSQRITLRKVSAETKRRYEIDGESLSRLKEKSQRIIRTLERHLKRANARLLSFMERPSFDAYMKLWRAHVRWMRIHLVYFKPLTARPLSSRRRCQVIIDELQKLAEVSISEEGYQLPKPIELRRVIRLFASYSRRGRLGFFDIRQTLTGSSFAKTYLVEFILDRLKLTEIPEK